MQTTEKNTDDRPLVYLHGMVLWSRIHRLQGAHPGPDSYAEIAESWAVPGGEAANAAILLSRLGLRTRLDGPRPGRLTHGLLLPALAARGVEAPGLTQDDGYDGLEDLVLVAGTTRTVLGTFQRYFAEGQARWSPPDRAALAQAAAVALDPYFGAASELAAGWCRELGKPLVTLDCAPESPLHQAAAWTVISREYLRREFPDADPEALIGAYARANRGWTVFTDGAQGMRYARAGEAVRHQSVFPVTVKGTLGAGDSFRAGLVYGLVRGFGPDRSVAFAAALAALVCARFPVAADPPALADVEALLATRPPLD